MLNKLKGYLRNNTKFGRSRYLNYLYRYDMGRYLQHSGMERTDAQVIAAQIRLLVHALEKGLSVKEQKPEFGKEKVCALLELMDRYRQSGSNPDPQAMELAKAVLGSYTQNRLNRKQDISFVPEEYRLPDDRAGVKLHRIQERCGFSEIAHGRHSIRSFAEGPVCHERVFAAVALAQTAPSACNRQATHVYCCTNATMIAKIVAKHGGLRGFSNIAAVLAVTGDLCLYQSEYERNTVFVDGGIFLMNLLYALETQDLAACPIIWGAEPDNDRFLFDLLKIPESHEIVSLVAVGKAPEEEIKIPCSTKRETKSIMHIIE